MNSLFLVSSNIEQFNINTLTFLLVIIGLTLLKSKNMTLRWVVLGLRNLVGKNIVPRHLP